MITTAEFWFWCVAGVIGILVAIAIPMLCNYSQYKEACEKCGR